MVRWLARDNVFAPPPRNLKLLETRTVSLLGKNGRLYVYKFKTAWRGREWIIGISGPQPMDRNKIVTAGAGTFSSNSSLRDKDMDEQLRDLRYEISRRSATAKGRRSGRRGEARGRLGTE